MTSMHFQLEREHQRYEIELQPTDVWDSDEVLIDGKRYILVGDHDQLQWIREQISQFADHENISSTDLQSRLINIGAGDISVDKAHEVGVRVLSSNARQIEALQQHLEEKTTRRLDLQKRLKEAASDVESLKASLMEAKRAEMDVYLQYMALKENFRGVVRISEEGSPILFEAYGPTDETGAPNRTDTRFCIGSMTKQFTAASIALLMQNKALITNPEVRERLGLDKGGSLTLQTSIRDLLPAKYWSPKWEGITLEDLLRHTSGLPCYGSFPEDEEREQNFTVDDLVSLVKDHDLLFNPGEMYFYSNDGYVLLGAIIENLSEKSLEAFMSENIFQPAHMEHTGMFASYDETSVANGLEDTEEGTLRKIPMPRHISKTYAAGSIISTAEDLEKWNQLLYGDALFSEETKKMMFSCPHPRIWYDDRKDSPLKYATDAEGKHHPMPGNSYPEIHYGFGIGVSCDPKIPDHTHRGDILQHDGALPGFSSFMARYIPSKRCIILLENNGDVPKKEKVQRHLEDILFA